jgi:hypothetical protein
MIREANRLVLANRHFGEAQQVTSKSMDAIPVDIVTQVAASSRTPRAHNQL